jgi:hypothetical protein
MGEVVMSEVEYVPVKADADVVVEDPPVPYHTSGRRTAWGAILGRVRAEAGAWCRVGEYDGEHRARRAGSVRAWLKAAPLGRGFEFCTRRVTLPDGRKVCRLFARTAIAPEAVPQESVPSRCADSVPALAPVVVS